jgi:adenylate cyclase
MRRLSALIILFSSMLSTYGQDEVVDSLKAVLKTTMPDSSRVSALLELSTQYYRTDPEQARTLAVEARDLAGASGYRNGLARAHKAVGMTYYFQGKEVEALVNWKLALEAFKANNDLIGVSNILNNLGAVYFVGGDDKAALDYYLEALRVAEASKDPLRTVSALVNIGTVYLDKDASTGMALQYYQRALPLSKALGDLDSYGTKSTTRRSSTRPRPTSSPRPTMPRWRWRNPC